MVAWVWSAIKAYTVRTKRTEEISSSMQTIWQSGSIKSLVCTGVKLCEEICFDRIQLSCVMTQWRISRKWNSAFSIFTYHWKHPQLFNLALGLCCICQQRIWARQPLYSYSPWAVLAVEGALMQLHIFTVWFSHKDQMEHSWPGPRQDNQKHFSFIWKCGVSDK